MEKAINQRILSYLQDNRISLNAFAKNIGWNAPTVFRQAKGQQTLSAALVENFLSVFSEVSAEWLIRGDGEMLRQEQVESQQENVSTNTETGWKIRYEELEKRYDELVNLINKKL